MKSLAIICLVGCSTSAEPARPTATVRAFEEGLGAAGRIAVFGDALGRVTSVEPTDRFGIATGAVDPGGVVTIANVGAPKFELTTYVDITPGDEMVIGETEDEGKFAADDVGAVVVGVAQVPEGMRAEVGIGLSMLPHVGRPLALHLSKRFFAPASPTAQLLGLARDGAGIARAFSIGEVAAAGDVTLPAWRTDWDPLTFAVAGVAPPLTIDARVTVLQGEGRFAIDPVTTTASTFEVPVPRGLGRELEYELEIRDGNSTRWLRERSVLRHELAVDARSWLARITSLGVAPVADGRPIVSWTVGVGAPADFVMVQLEWGDGAHRWTIVLPASHVGSFRLPELPESLAGWRPTGDLHVGVALVELSAIASYHELMKRGVEEIDALDAPGTVRISRFGELDL